MTILNRNSKACTKLLLDAAETDIYIDLSQERTTLVDMTTYLKESPSPRTAIDAERSVSVVVNITYGDEGTLVFHGNAGSYGYKMVISNGMEVEVAEGGLLRLSLPLGLAKGEESVKHLIHWGQYLDGSTVVSELALYRYDTDTWTFATGRHTATTTNPGHTLTIGAGFGGSTPYTTGYDGILLVRIGQRMVSTTEASEDFVTESTPPAFVGRRRTPLLTGPTEELEIDVPGNFAGPQYFMALAETKEADARAKTALVNLVHNNPAVETNNYTPANWVTPAPGTPTYHMNLRYLWHGPVTRVNRARCRIYVQAYNLGGPGPICPLHFRMYSLGDFGTTPKPTFKNYRRTPDHTPITTAGRGWLDLGVLPLLYETAGNNQIALCGLAYSFNLDDGDPLEDQTGFKILAVTIEPFYVELNDDEGDDKKGPAKKAP